ncbi:acyl-CoA reductase [Clostridium sp. SM-530-WT-3G]|uniref:acyl-CoA reductase n=1 Tax=Clostridium sp. SM-530-WT-3G TaxID=2725303 RepID=UPI00145D0016|nr:acyl-CoA reductase [Clostridium sp. SM-530-WT-3G]NME82778.1 acyl-CoA reductase [Clostridium sp. SM-530-WT-3G]
MQINLNNINYLYYNGKSFEEMKKLKALQPFSAQVCNFLNELSKAIMLDKEAKKYADIITFGFFCRKANIERLKEKYIEINKSHIGRGLSFHIAPSNVPINFAYSLVVGLLSGNSCIVRISSKKFEQTKIVCKLLSKVLKKHGGILKDYILILNYNRDSNLTEYFSSICDSRIIWGGDNTINKIRKFNIPIRSIDIAFADRYSIAIINSMDIINHPNMKKLAQDFYNDTYLYDQNACSSPRLIVWLGDNENIGIAKKIFWSALHEFIVNKYTLESVIVVDKLLTSYRCAICLEDIHIENLEDNLINRIQLNSLTDNIEDFKCAGGIFFEYSDNNLNSLASIITNKYQTVSYFGIDPLEIRKWVFKNGLTGIDRIVPIGKAADFSLVWDGCDLIRSLTRICDVM